MADGHLRQSASRRTTSTTRTGRCEHFRRPLRSRVSPQLRCDDQRARLPRPRSERRVRSKPQLADERRRKPGWKVTLQRQTGATTFVTVGVPDNNRREWASTTSRDSDREATIASAFSARVLRTGQRESRGRYVRSRPLRSSAGAAKITSSSPDSKGISVAPLTTAGNDQPGLRRRSRHGVRFRGRRHRRGQDELRCGCRRCLDEGRGALHAGDVHQQRPPVLHLRAHQRLHAATCGQIYLLEDLQGTIAQSALGRGQADLAGVRRQRAVHELPADAVLPAGSARGFADGSPDRQGAPDRTQDVVHRRRASDGPRRRIWQRTRSSTSSTSSTRRTTAGEEWGRSRPGDVPLGIVARRKTLHRRAA